VSVRPYPRDMRDGPSPTPTRAERRDQATEQTRSSILAAARECLLADGYASLSTRRVAEAAEVPLSQIHYHFGSKQQLILEVLAGENARLLDRQEGLFAGNEPLWRQWEQAVGYLDDDLRSGYVRVLNELIAAGWSEPTLAAAVRGLIGSWFRLLTNVARRVAAEHGGLGPFTPDEIGALMALPYVGAEPMILLGFAEADLPARSALRKIGAVIRLFEEGTVSLPAEIPE
jgi:AcrR family transcriptional regulator